MTYKPFSHYIFRTPAFSIQKWQSYISEAQNNNYNSILTDNCFLEALFIASPALYDEVVKYKTGNLPKKEEDRFFSSLLRYLTRMSWRCTPFGLFSGCSVGTISDKNDVVLPQSAKFKRHTRLDMNYLCALIQVLSQKDEIQPFLKYFPNTSIYEIGCQLRYIEYTFVNTYRKHRIVSAENSKYLQLVLQSAVTGQTIDCLANLLVEDDISYDEARRFIMELVDSQLLMSELEPSVTGNDVLDALVENLTSINKDFPVIQQLVEIQDYLKIINDTQIGNTIPLYDKITTIIKAIGVDFELKFLFQTDLIKTPIKATVSETLLKDVWNVVVLLNKLKTTNLNTNLNNFISAFSNRYESKEMPLLTILDNETGIGYPVGKDSNIAPLLDKFAIPVGNQNDKQQIEWDNIQSVLHKKFLEAHAQKQHEIKLYDTDFILQAENWTDTPDTFSVLCKIFSIKDEQPLIYFSSYGGSSAANLLARFAHADKEIEEHVLSITKKEEELQKDAILAEIVHLPQARIGNIIFRPSIRPYEIPYLAKPSVEKECQLPLSDLFISVRRNQIYLRSKRLNRLIVPRLTNAHNYSVRAMPVYHFLCDLQTHNQRSSFGLSWSRIVNDYYFLPRITYKNVILSLARWIIKTDDLKKRIAENNMEMIALWRNENLMSRYLFLPDGDNDFFVDMENLLSIKTLLDVVKRRKEFFLMEFPYDLENPLAIDSQGNIFTNELIFNFYKEKS